MLTLFQCFSSKFYSNLKFHHNIRNALSSFRKIAVSSVGFLSTPPITPHLTPHLHQIIFLLLFLTFFLICRKTDKIVFYLFIFLPFFSFLVKIKEKRNTKTKQQLNKSYQQKKRNTLETFWQFHFRFP